MTRSTKVRCLSGFIALFALTLYPLQATTGTPAYELLVSSRRSHSILRFNPQTKEYLGTLVAPGSGGLLEPEGMLIGPDGLLYVCGIEAHAVFRFNPSTGAFIDKFASGGGLARPHDCEFGPDGNLYVASFANSKVLKFNGQTGEYLGDFAQNAQLAGAIFLAFRGDKLYVTGHFSQNVVRFDAQTGAFIDVFTPPGTPGLQGPCGFDFGPDGDLFVGMQGTDRVQRFDGVTGAYKGDFVTSRSGGMIWAENTTFGQDGLLYVCTRDTNRIFRYDGQTGAFVDDFTPADTGGMNFPSAVLFVPTLNVQLTARIEPSLPKTLDDLTCVTTVDNTGNYPQLDLSYRWFRNGLELLEDMTVHGEWQTVTGPILSHHYTRKNQLFQCEVTVTDGSSHLTQKTAPVAVRNSTPSAPVVQILPPEPRPGQSLGINILVYSTDADGDEVEYRIDWYESEDGGVSWIHKIELRDHAFIDGIYLEEGDLWRVVITPYEVPDTGAKPTTSEEVVEGEMGWDQVYVGENSRPVVTINQPGPAGLTAMPGVNLAWHATDAEGDPVSVDLYYDTDGIKGDSILIASGLAASGTLYWQPPAPGSGGVLSDLNKDGNVDFGDLFLMSSHWFTPVQGQTYRILARAWDSRKAYGEVFSEGAVTVPDSLPCDKSGILQMFGSWHSR